MTDPGEWQRIGNHKFLVEGDIVYSVWDGPSTLAEVQAFHGLFERVLAEHGRAFSLIDMRKAHSPTPDTRQWLTEWSERYQIAAVACFGASFTVRTIATLLVRAIRLLRKGPGGVMGFFETEASARAFLNAERARLEARQSRPPKSR
jgi:hypothetical protein